MAELPMLPDEWRLVVSASTSDQFANVRRALLAPEVTGVICATDAGREGELIFRYIYEAARCTKPVRRLWISSLTPDAIARGFRDLRDGSEYDALARAARARSRADWLVGMNLSRAYSLVHNDVFSVGRVQTPTLAMLVAREQEIRSFVPEDYIEVVATFATRGTRGDVRRHVVSGRIAAPPEGRSAGVADRRARLHGRSAHRVGRARGAPRAAAAPLRSHGAAAPREPALRNERAAHARRGPGALRATQAPQLSAYRQPPADARHRRDAARGDPRDRRSVPGAPRPGDGRASARVPLRRRRAGHRPPRHHPDRRRGPRPISPATSDVSTTSCAGACSPRGTRITCTRRRR